MLSLILFANFVLYCIFLQIHLPTLCFLCERCQVRRLTMIVEQSEQGLGSATSQVTSLHDANSRLKAELDQIRQDLRTNKAKLTTISVSWQDLGTNKAKLTTISVSWQDLRANKAKLTTISVSCLSTLLEDYYHCLNFWWTSAYKQIGCKNFVWMISSFHGYLRRV